MQLLSAIDAISPALARTKLVLFSPFRFGRAWKLAVTSYLSTMGTFFIPFPLLIFLVLPLIKHRQELWVGLAVVFGASMLTLLFVWLFSLCSRLQFTFFDLTLNHEDQIRISWRKFGAPSSRATKFKIIAGTIATVIFGTPVALVIKHTIRSSQSGPSYQPWFAHSAPAFFSVVFGGYLAIGLLFYAATIANDFLLPSMALEDLTVAAAWGRVLKLVSGEPGQFALYALLKMILGMAAQMACSIAMEVVLIIAILIVGAASLLIGWLLHLVGVPQTVLSGLGITVIFGVYITFIVLSMPLAGGIPMAFLEAYRLCFLGGRYQMLGDLLDRSTPFPAPTAYVATTHYANPYPVCPPAPPPSEE